MHDLALSGTAPRAQAAAVPPGPGRPTASFRELLAGLTGAGAAPAPAQPAIRVRPGDCLSRICADRLRESGASASRGAIHAAVQAVAKANHLADPDRIHPGQQLDLSMLGQAGAGQDAPGAAGAQGSPAPWHALVDGAAALSSAFGLRRDPFSGRVARHDGIDLAARGGAPVAAFESGTVVFSGWKAGYGNTVVIRHEDGQECLYGHLARPLVQAGQQVEAHAPIASVGSNGRSTGPHLHFEVRRNGKAVDPMPRLGLDPPIG